jgi:hypothetical protein
MQFIESPRPHTFLLARLVVPAWIRRMAGLDHRKNAFCPARAGFPITGFLMCTMARLPVQIFGLGSLSRKVNRNRQPIGATKSKRNRALVPPAPFKQLHRHVSPTLGVKTSKSL